MVAAARAGESPDADVCDDERAAQHDEDAGWQDVVQRRAVSDEAGEEGCRQGEDQRERCGARPESEPLDLPGIVIHVADYT